MGIEQSENREFEVSPAIIRHLIESQSGSIEKAVLELVMNAIDAHASEVRIELADADRIVVTDNGTGFRTIEDVHEHFGVFGFDHSSEAERARERKLGRFGLGRGQIMAFAATDWESNRFEMNVDIRERLGFVLTEHRDRRVDGCRVTARLHHPLGRAERMGVQDEIAHQTRYAPIDVIVDGKKVNEDTERLKWTEETAELWFAKHHQGHGNGVHVYNLGVYVRTYPHERMGVSGALVSKPGNAFELNTARNDVLQAKCPLWKEAKELLARQAQRSWSREGLSDQDRMAMARGLLYGEGDPREGWRRGLLESVTGRFLSPETVMKRFAGKVCVCPHRGSQIAERVQSERVAAMLCPEVLGWYRAKDPEDLAKRLNAIFDKVRRGRFEAADFDQVSQGFDTQYRIIARKGWTPIERAAHRGLGRLGNDIAWEVQRLKRRGNDGRWSEDEHGGWLAGRGPTPPTRKIRIGESRDALAWTDGATFIAFDRRYISRQLSRELPGWGQFYATMVHEYAHDTPDTGMHVHGPQFHEQVHDIFVGAWGVWMTSVLAAYRLYARAREREGVKPSMSVAKTLDRIDQVRQHRDLCR